MYSRIFTPKEREVINRFFKGEVRAGDDIMRQIVYRIRLFEDLARDVELYCKLRKAISTVSA
jgi:hypothetical protein